METKCEAEIDDAALHLIFLHEDRYGRVCSPGCNTRIHSPASAKLQSEREKNVIQNDTNVILEVLEDVLNGFCMINDYQSILLPRKLNQEKKKNAVHFYV